MLKNCIICKLGHPYQVVTVLSLEGVRAVDALPFSVFLVSVFFFVSVFIFSLVFVFFNVFVLFVAFLVIPALSLRKELGLWTLGGRGVGFGEVG